MDQAIIADFGEFFRGSLVYTSVIAPTEELDGLFQTSGGGVQFIIPDRKLFTSPELIGSI